MSKPTIHGLRLHAEPTVRNPGPVPGFLPTSLWCRIEVRSTDHISDGVEIAVHELGRWMAETQYGENEDYDKFIDEIAAAFTEQRRRAVAHQHTAEQLLRNAAPDSECHNCGLDHPWACVECGSPLNEAD